jgi:hypothetical protein
MGDPTEELRRQQLAGATVWGSLEFQHSARLHFNFEER